MSPGAPGSTPPFALSLSKGPGSPADALALAAAIVAGELSAREAMERTLAAVQQANPQLNALWLVDAERALRQAEALDAERAACRSDTERQALLARRPFFGVPLALKDIGAATAHPDFPSTMGSRVFDGTAGEGRRGLRWPAMGQLMARYLAAGFVPFGRSTVPEMGISASTEARANGGPTRSPFSPLHSAGGSSGGAAALTAAGVVPLAHANDGAGSIRIPASACGLWGLKPSRGLMPMGPLIGEVWGGMATDHVVSRTLRDTAAALDATAGADPGAPYAAPPFPGSAANAAPPVPGSAPTAPTAPSSFLHALQIPPPRLRIALCNRFFEGDPVHPDVAAAVAAVAAKLERAGHVVEEAAPPFATRDVVLPLMQVVASGVAQGLDAAGRARGRPVEEGDVEPTVWGAYRVGRELAAARYLDALTALHLLGRRMAEFHARHPVLLTPVLAEPPARLGRFAMHNPDFIDYRLGPAGLWRYSPFTPLANATGAPSLAVPAGFSAEGLPIGAMLSAALGEDALLLQLAAQL